MYYDSNFNEPKIKSKLYQLLLLPEILLFAIASILFFVSLLFVAVVNLFNPLNFYHSSEQYVTGLKMKVLINYYIEASSIG